MATEDFTTYTVNDPGADLTVTATKVDAVDAVRSDDYRVHDDKGAAHFAGDFEHLFELYVDSASDTDALNYPWAMPDSVGGWGSWGNLHAVRIKAGSADWAGYLYENTGSGDNADFIGSGGSFDTLYYAEIERDESVGTHGDLEMRIYSDSARTTLVNTWNVTLNGKIDFRYIYGIGSQNGGGSTLYTGYTQNLDLQEGSSTPTTPTGLTGAWGWW